VTVELDSHHNKVSFDIIQLKRDWNIGKRKQRIGWMCGTGTVAARSNSMEMNWQNIRNVKHREQLTGSRFLTTSHKHYKWRLYLFLCLTQIRLNPQNVLIWKLLGIIGVRSFLQCGFPSCCPRHWNSNNVQHITEKY